MEETTKIVGTVQYGSFGLIKAMTHNLLASLLIVAAFSPILYLFLPAMWFAVKYFATIAWLIASNTF